MLSETELVHGQGTAARAGGFEGFTDGEEHADFVLGGELNDLSDLLWIEADHGTGVVAHGFGGEHEGLADDADGAKGFIVLELRLIFVKLVDHGDDGFLNGFGGLTPIAFGLLVCF